MSDQSSNALPPVPPHQDESVPSECMKQPRVSKQQNSLSV